MYENGDESDDDNINKRNTNNIAADNNTVVSAVMRQLRYRKSCNKQPACASVRVMQSAFTESSITLLPIRVNETREIAELTAL